jgi:uncharacterized protein with HEPN domain
MSSDKKWSFRLQHILHAIEKIQRYTEEHTEESFGSDEKTIDAVIRNFQVIGEAARLIPDNVQSAHPDIPWSDMQNSKALEKLHHCCPEDSPGQAFNPHHV